MSVEVDSDFASDDRARAEIGAAVRYLLRDAPGSARDEIVEAITALVRDVADGPLAPGMSSKQPPMSGVAYKDYVIDAYRRDTDRWRATIRRSNGKKIRIAFPPSVRDEVTTVTDAITAEKAVEFAKRAIDGGEVI
jgi:plasmid stabilization system protein ParE